MHNTVYPPHTRNANRHYNACTSTTCPIIMGQRNRVILAAYLLFAGVAGQESVLPDAVLSIATPQRNFDVMDPFEFGCYSSAYPTIIRSNDKANSDSYMAVVARGNCSFASKVLAAQDAGISAVVIFDSIPGMYIVNNYSLLASPDIDYMYMSSCDVHCPYGSAIIDTTNMQPSDAYAGLVGQCNAGGHCASNLCGFTSPGTAGSKQREICCVVSDLQEMGGFSSATNDVKIPSVFVTVSDGAVLAEAAAGKFGRADAAFNATVTFSQRETPSFQAGTFLLWILGSAVAIFGAYLSGKPEPQRQVASTAANTAVTARPPPVSISVLQAVFLLIFACAVLITLFMLVKMGINIVIIIIVVFCFASVSAVFHMITYPLVCKFLPKMEAKTIFNIQNRFIQLHWTAAMLIAFVVALGPMTLWVTTRQRDFAWVFNDALGVVICCLVLTQLRVAKLRDITVLFILFFAYDIFMVFLSPYVFGSSVMVEVATAGQPAPQADWTCFCRLHPTDSASCGPGEIMPILFRLPRIGDYRGGYAMLGFGDIIIPGLLLAFLARFDRVLRIRALLRSYCLIGSVGYILGLGLANLAVILMQVGQPALLYLCPCTLLPVVLIAYTRNDLASMWKGAIPTISMEAGTVALAQEGHTAQRLPSNSGSVDEQSAGEEAPLTGPATLSPGQSPETECIRVDVARTT